MDILKDFGVFLWAVITNWAGFTTGGVVVALVALYTLWKQPPPRWVGVSLAILFLFVSFFVAWRDQYKTRLECDGKLQQTLPVIQAKFGADTMTTYAGKDCNLILVINGYVHNVGFPSVLSNWKLDLIFPDGRELHGVHKLRPPNDATVHVTRKNPGDEPIEMDGSAYLPILTNNAPISTGGGASGWMWADFPTACISEIERDDPVVRLSVDDVKDKTWTFQHRFKEQPK